MGFLYVKIIEARKIAVRTSFFVNYPFVRIICNKEKRNTNFKPGIEWWDKILSFKVFKESTQQIIIQARDKSIHVFGSDWLGEVTVELKDLLDGNAHQKWYKLGKGHRNHSRAPRGYIHLALQYIDEDGEKRRRPFADPPLEPVCTFDEFLAREEDVWHDDIKKYKEPEPPRPTPKKMGDSDPDRLRRSNEDASAIRSSSQNRRLHPVDSTSSIDSDSDDDGEDHSSDDYVVNNLVDLNFNTPKQPLAHSYSSNGYSSLASSSTSCSSSSPSNGSSPSNLKDSSTDCPRSSNPFRKDWTQDFVAPPAFTSAN
eukprot:TRINITY_DN7593_c0_g1_i1.p1 TRINITY_DN7593_c0_g1~~TRINITY_DN7593_c0_g1_i1.p1  ORF type:complete len:312 (+),score=66.39 TRINITY_DN7593_c0_g1_i1:135-1070(+)